MNSAPLVRPSRLHFTVALLLGTAFAGTAQAETFTITNVTGTAQPLYKYEIPTIEVVDGNLTEAETRELFQFSQPADLGKWGTVTAKSLKIPELRITASVPTATSGSPTEETIIYRNLELKDVVDGVAGGAYVGGAEVVVPGAMTLKFGEMSTGRFDLGGMMSFYGVGPAPASREMKEIYADFRFSGGTLDVEGVFQCSFGDVVAGKFFARPLQMSIADLEAVVARLQEAETAKTAAVPADVKQLIAYYADMLTAFRSDPMTFGGFDCSGTDPDTEKPIYVRSGAINIGGFEPGIYPDISVDNFSFDALTDGYFNVGNVTWKRMDLNGPISALSSFPEAEVEAWFTTNWRKLIPAMDGLSFKNVSFDLPDPATPGGRAKGTADLLDIDLGSYVNGIPSAISLELDGAVMPVPAEMAKGVAANYLAAYGINELKSDTHVKLRWDEAKQAIAVEELLVDTSGLFRIAVKGTLGNATSALFGDAPEAAMAAGLGLTIKDLTVELEDRGFYGMALQISAAESGQPFPAARTAISGMAQGMTLAVIGSDPSSLAAVGELGKFLSGTNSKLSLTITANDSAGISLAQLSALEKDPTALAGKITVSATASGDAVALITPPADATPEVTEEPQTEEMPADAPSLQDQKRDLKTPAQN